MLSCEFVDCLFPAWLTRSARSTCLHHQKSLVQINDSRNRVWNQFKEEILSPIAFKLVADAYFTSQKVPVPHEYIIPLKRKSLEHMISSNCQLQPGIVIFVETIAVNNFFSSIYNRINVPFVLVSGDSDYSSPSCVRMGEINNKCHVSTNKIEQVLNSSSSKILQIFNQTRGKTALKICLF